MAYLLDSDVFIAAKNSYYGFSLCPGFWDWIDEANAAGRVFSVEKVGDELEVFDDELRDWARQHGPDLFLPLGPEIAPALTTVSEWVSNQSYEQAAVNTFLGVADYFLVAQALADGHVVVTHERAASSTKKIKIPNVCIGLKVKFMSPFDMLKRERVRFVLEGASA